MKSIVGFAFFLLFIAGFAFVFLKGKQLEKQQDAVAQASSFHGVDWTPVKIGGNPVAEDTTLVLRIEEDGSITGHAGCNRFFGSLEATQNGFQIGPLGATRMACPEPVMSLEFEFLKAIEQSSNFETGPGRMQLLGDASEILAEFVVAAPKPAN